MKEPVSLIEKIGNVLNRIGSAIMMNLLFLAACLPIVTIGQAWCGLLSAIRYEVRGEKWFDGFKKGFKTRFWRGTVSWCIMLVVDAYFIREMNFAWVNEYLATMIASSFMFALASMITTSLLALNVYIPTPIGEWVRNAVNMVFKAPLQLLGAALMFWLPVLLFMMFPNIFFLLLMVFIAAYYTVAALGITVVLKQPLVYYLLAARASGTLLAEEGRLANAQEEAPAEDPEY